MLAVNAAAMVTPRAAPPVMRISEDAARAAWLAKLDTPSWGVGTSVDDADGVVVPVTQAPYQEEQAKQAWLAKLEAPFGSSPVSAPIESDVAKKEAWMEKLDVASWGQATPQQLVELVGDCEGGDDSACGQLSRDEILRQEYAQYYLKTFGEVAALSADCQAGDGVACEELSREEVLRREYADYLKSDGRLQADYAAYIRGSTELQTEYTKYLKGAAASGTGAADGIKNLMQQVKDAGVAGAIAYAGWELIFWAVSVPVCIGAYYQVTGHFPDFDNQEDMAKLGAEAFAFVNLARFAVPVRIGLALGSVPFVQTQILDRFATARSAAANEPLSSLAPTRPDALPGVSAPLGFWDPLKLSEGATAGRMKFYQESELKHGRISMVAVLGFLVAENFHPMLEGDLGVPSLVGLDAFPAPVQALFFVLVGAIEGSTLLKYQSPLQEVWSLRADHTPGDLQFDPLNLMPTDAQSMKIRRTQELNNGRLAMVAILGMVAQEVATGSKVAWLDAEKGVGVLGGLYWTGL